MEVRAARVRVVVVVAVVATLAHAAVGRGVTAPAVKAAVVAPAESQSRCFRIRRPS
jgi:hypothetical protein